MAVIAQEKKVQPANFIVTNAVLQSLHNLKYADKVWPTLVLESHCPVRFPTIPAFPASERQHT